VQTVQPGDVIFANITIANDHKSYNMYIAANGKPGIVSNIAVEAGKLYTDVYFVVEHQPNSCAEYPASGSVTFTNINIA
jgi:hypothetical protein